MKKTSTLKKVFLRKENILLAAMLGLLIVFGCYEFKLVDQPTEANSNSSFDVNFVMIEDDDPTNDWTLEDGSLTKAGLFGVLLPEGWTIEDNIMVTIEAADSIETDDGYAYATADHDGTYTLAYSEDQTTMLNDSTGDAPPGYYWWGAETTEPVDMAFFDSLYFTLTVMTDDQTGDFFLQYAVGDVDSDNRMPYDPETLTEPIPITITSAVGLNEVLNKTSVSTYPNPSFGYLNIRIDNYDGNPVDAMIYNVRGKQIKTLQLKARETTLDVVDMTPGVYFLRMDNGEETLTRQFIKK